MTKAASFRVSRGMPILGISPLKWLACLAATVHPEGAFPLTSWKGPSAIAASRPKRYSGSEKPVTGIPNRRSSWSSNPRSCQPPRSGARSPTRMWSAWNAARASSARKKWIVGSDRSTRFRSQLFDLAQDRLKALVSLLARLVGPRSQPLEPSWQCRRHHQHLIGRVYEFADSVRQCVGGVSCLTGRDQQSLGHRPDS